MSYKWIPAREAALVLMCKKWLTFIVDEAMYAERRWDAGLCKIVEIALLAYIAAVDAFTKNDNTENYLTKASAKKAAVKAIRDFARTSVRNNPFLNDELRQELGVHIPDTTPTPQLRPIDAPNTTVDGTSSHLQHRVKALNPETGKTGKPTGVHGVRFVWQVGGERPHNGASMLKGQFSRKPDIIVSHDESDRGKPVYYASCYENTKGEAGPWSIVVDAYLT